MVVGVCEWVGIGADDCVCLCRFHAWQSALLFSAMFVVHLVFAWSSFLSWVLLVGDVGMIGYLTMRAYKDGECSFWCGLLVGGRC